MKKIIDFIRNNTGELLTASLISLCYLGVMTMTYGVISTNTDGSLFMFIFSCCLYAIQTLIYLVILLSIF